MNINWARIYNMLFPLIDTAGETYFSGGRFINAVREFDPYFPNYNQLIDQRRSQGKSTSRRDYYYDVLMAFSDEGRFRIVSAILNSIQGAAPEKVSEIRDAMGGQFPVPTPQLPEDLWNRDKFGRMLDEVDARIASGNHAGAVTLCYTCLEGFLKAFVHQNIPSHSGSLEIVDSTKAVRGFLKNSVKCPDEVFSMLGHVAHTVDRTRNGFSESHFDQDADRWLATFVRDLVNSEIRLLLHFMKG